MSSVFSKASVIDLYGQPGTISNPPANTARLYYNSTTNQVVAVDSHGTSLISGFGASISLKTNGVANASQTVLNIIAGTGITATADGSGGVTFAAPGAGATFYTKVSLTANQIKVLDLTPITILTAVPNKFVMIQAAWYVLNQGTVAFDVDAQVNLKTAGALVGICPLRTIGFNSVATSSSMIYQGFYPSVTDNNAVENDSTEIVGMDTVILADVEPGGTGNGTLDVHVVYTLGTFA